MGNIRILDELHEEGIEEGGRVGYPRGRESQVGVHRTGKGERGGQVGEYEQYGDAMSRVSILCVGEPAAGDGGGKRKSLLCQLSILLQIKPVKHFQRGFPKVVNYSAV